MQVFSLEEFRRKKEEEAKQKRGLDKLARDIETAETAEKQHRAQQNWRLIQQLLKVLPLVFISVQAQASTLKVNPTRLVEVIDVIDGSILQQAQQVDSLSRTSTLPIYVLFNSPGGMVGAGNILASAMIAAKSRGTLRSRISRLCFL